MMDFFYVFIFLFRKIIIYLQSNYKEQLNNKKWKI